MQVSPQGKLPVRLPNGWRICHSCSVEAAFIYEEIFEERCYIQHGIAVRDGDICVDVGANIGRCSELHAHSLQLTVLHCMCRVLGACFAVICILSHL